MFFYVTGWLFNEFFSSKAHFFRLKLKRKTVLGISQWDCEANLFC